MTQKRLNQVLLYIFIIAIALAIILSAIMDANSASEVKLACVKYLLQLAVVVVVGGIVGALFKLHDQQRARDEAILRSQSQLLDDVSETILTYETVAAEITWAKNENVNDEKMHEVAFERYNDRVIDLVSQWRALAAKSRTLASRKVSEKIANFLMRIFTVQDTPMMRLHRDKATAQLWQQQHEINVAMIEEANQLIEELANDMSISKNVLANSYAE